MDLSSAMAMKRGTKTALIVLIVVLFLVYALYSLVGISVKPPKDSPPAGATILFLRRGTTLPFLSSPDSQKQKAQGAPSGTLVPLFPLENRVIARLPYNRSLYLRTTGGVEFLK